MQRCSTHKRRQGRLRAAACTAGSLIIHTVCRRVNYDVLHAPQRTHRAACCKMSRHCTAAAPASEHPRQASTCRAAASLCSTTTAAAATCISTRLWSCVLLAIHAMALLHCTQCSLLILQVGFLVLARWVVKQNDEIAVLHIETAEMLRGLLGIINILIDYICSTTRLLGRATAGGGGGAVCAMVFLDRGTGGQVPHAQDAACRTRADASAAARAAHMRIWRMAPYLPNSSYICRQCSVRQAGAL